MDDIENDSVRRFVMVLSTPIFVGFAVAGIAVHVFDEIRRAWFNLDIVSPLVRDFGDAGKTLRIVWSKKKERNNG